MSHQYKTKLYVLLMIVILVTSTIPVTARITVKPLNSNTNFFVGSFRDVVAVGDNITFFAVLWNLGSGPLQGEDIIFKIQYFSFDNNTPEVVFEYLGQTNENGYINVTITASKPGKYIAEICYQDVCQEATVNAIDPEEYFYPYAVFPKFGTHWVVRANDTWPAVDIKLFLVNPYTMVPYSGEVNLTFLWREKGVSRTIKVNVTNGILNYMFNVTNVFPDFDGYNVDVFVGKEFAGTIGYRNDLSGDEVWFDEMAYEGENVTFIYFARDLSTIPAKLISDKEVKFNITYYYKNGTMRTETIERTATDGYLIYTMNTLGLKSIHVKVYAKSPWGVYYPVREFDIEILPRPVTKIPSILFDITPTIAVANPRDTIEFIISANALDESALTKNYTVYIEWYKWSGSWYSLNLERIDKYIINFTNGNEARIRVQVPEWTGLGRITVGSVSGYILIQKPTLYLWPYLNYTYSQGQYVYSSKLPTWMILSNSTVPRWMWWLQIPEYEELSQPMPDEKVYIFTKKGNVVTNSSDGWKLVEIPFEPSKNLPLVAGIGYWDDYSGNVYSRDVQTQWFLALHESGAYGIGSLYIPRITVGVEVRNDKVYLKKFMWENGKFIPTSIPVVVAILTPTNEVLKVIYWNTTELTLPVSVPEFNIRVFPNVHLSYMHNLWNYAWHFYQTERDFSSGLQFNITEINTTSSWVSIPAKAPSESVVCVLTDKRFDTIRCVKSDSKGNVNIEIPVPQSGYWSININYWIFTQDGSVISGNYPIFVRKIDDNIPPTIKVDITPQIQDVGKNVTINVYAKDSSGLSKAIILIEDYYGNVYLNHTTEISGFENTIQVTFQIPKLADYRVIAEVEDSFGNKRKYVEILHSKESKKLEVPMEEGRATIDIEDTTIEINGESTSTTIPINITVSSNPTDENATIKLRASSAEDIKTMKIEVGGDVKYNWVILNMTYNESVLRTLGITEDDLTILYWNGSDWIDLRKNVGKTIPDSSKYGYLRVYGFGIDKEHNYVWANVSHLSTYSIATVLPDLEIEDISVPQELYDREEATLYIYIQNSGKSIETQFKVVLYINDQLVFEKIINGINGGETVSIPVKWMPPEPGKYVIRAIVDPDDSIQEVNENDNDMLKVVMVEEKPAEETLSLEKSTTNVNYATLAVLYYMWYNRLAKEYKEMLQNAPADIVNKSLEYYKLAEQHYEKGVRLNSFNVFSMMEFRKAWLYIKRGIEILKTAEREEAK